jgi:predicted RNA-binding protein YlxR (DUF448 family)
VRIVRTGDGEVLVDETGKLNGRGAYLCGQRSCWEHAIAHQHLERALKVTLADEAKERLLEHASGFPESLTAGHE